MPPDTSIAVTTTATVCGTCGKEAVLRSRPYRNPWYDPLSYARPVDGKTHTWECPDGHGCGNLVKVECHGTLEANRV